jgi:hypothetical protein
MYGFVKKKLLTFPPDPKYALGNKDESSINGDGHKINLLKRRLPKPH